MCRVAQRCPGRAFVNRHVPRAFVNESSKAAGMKEPVARYTCWGYGNFVMHLTACLAVLVESASFVTGFFILPQYTPQIANWKWVVFAMACVRAFLFLVFSIVLAPNKWIRCWRRMDTLLPSVIVTSISYCFLQVKEDNRMFGTIQVETIALFFSNFMYLFSVVGLLRTLIKYYDWSVKSITLYKVFRFVCLVVIVVYQNFLANGGGPEIAFFGTMFGLFSGMLSKAVDKSDEIRKAAKQGRRGLHPDRDSLIRLDSTNPAYQGRVNTFEDEDENASLFSTVH